MYRIFFTLLSVTTLFACEQAPQKTDSMIFRESTISDAQKPIQQSQALLTSAVRNDPMKHLDILIIANNAKNAARNIYQRGQIIGYKDESLLQLEDYFKALSPVLVEHAKALLEQVIERTVVLRKEIEDAKNQPYSARNTDTSQLVSFLGEQYNIDVKSCCLTQLSQIDSLLQGQPKQHRDLLILIRSINTELGNIIQRVKYEEELRERLKSIH